MKPGGGGHVDDDCAGVVSYERAPALIPRSTSGPITTEIFADCSRRNSDAELEQELICNVLLSPDWILAAHLPNQISQILRQRQTPALSRFPAPERPEAGPMPLYKGCRLDDHRRVSPVEQSAQTNHHGPERSGRPPWLYLAFLEQRQLSSEE